MKTIRSIFICYLWVNCVSARCNTIANSDSIKFLTGKFAEVLDKAAIEKKPVYVDMYTDWCVPCKKMEKQVFFNQEASDFFNKNFITFRINAEKGEGKELAKKYKIVAYPTSIYMNSRGELLKRVEGYDNLANFMKQAREAYAMLNDHYSLSDLEIKYKNGERGSDFMSTYLKKLTIYKQKREDILTEYLNKFPEKTWFTKENLELIVGHLETFDNNVYERFTDNLNTIENNKELRDLYVAARSMQFEITGRTFIKAVQLKDEELMNKWIQAKYHLFIVLPNQDPVDSSEYVYDLKLRYYYESKQMAIYIPSAVKEISRLMQISVDSIKKQDSITYKKFLFETNKIEDSIRRKRRLNIENERMKAQEANRIAKKLNGFAKAFCENVDDQNLLRNALAWCRRSYKYKKDVKSIETSAAILIKLDQKEEAITLLRQEIDKDKSPDEIAEHLKEICKVHKIKKE